MDILLDTAPCGFLSVRDDGSISLVNQTLLGWLGQALEELQGQNIDTILPASGRIFYQTHLFPLLRIQGHVEEVYLPLQHKDGSSIPMLMNAAIRQGHDVEFLCDCVFMPMYQRDRYENEILQAKATAEEAQRAKEEAYTDLEAFAYSVSHDLRSPLATIRIFAEYVLKDYAEKVDRRTQEALKYIVESAIEMSKLTEDILTYSQTSSSAVELQPVSLQTVVLRAADHLRAGYTEGDLQLDIVQPMPDVLAHPTLLGQVVNNLLANAVKFVAPDGRPRIKAWTEHGLTPQPMVRLWIEDNGIGIAPDDQERIFRLFERGYVQRKYPGTGIGLAIVRKAVERMGGRIGVESTLGVGSRFWVELPESKSPSSSS